MYVTCFIHVRDVSICATRRIHTCDMMYSYACQDSIICVTWRFHVCDIDSFMCVTWFMHVCDMTHSYVQRSGIGVKWLHMCDVTDSYVWHDLFICVTWLIHMRDMTHMGDMMHACLWQHVFTCVTWFIHMWDMTHSHVRHDSFICVTWLMHITRRVGKSFLYQNSNYRFIIFERDLNSVWERLCESKSIHMKHSICTCFLKFAIIRINICRKPRTTNCLRSECICVTCTMMAHVRMCAIIRDGTYSHMRDMTMNEKRHYWWIFQ